MKKFSFLIIIIFVYLNSLAQNLTVTATPFQNIIPCESDLGIISSSVTGGTPPFNYQWSDGWNTWNTEHLNFVFAGNYTVTVTDANLNTATASATITEYPHFWGFVNYHAPTPGNCNGSLLWHPWQPRVGLLYLSGLGPFTLISGQTGGMGLKLCQSSSPVTINLFTNLGCPWQFNGLTINPSQYTSGPYTITHQVVQQNLCVSDVSFTIYNANKLDSQNMPPPLNSGGYSVNEYTHVEIRDLQNNLVKEIFNAPVGQLMQYQDSITYNFSSIIAGTYVFHYVEGLYKEDMFLNPIDTFGIHLTDTFTVTGTGSLPVASITASGSTNICSGDSVLLNANTGTGLSYQWQMNGSNISGAISSSYIASTAGNYAVVVTDSCGSNTSNIITVTVGSVPSASISSSGSTNICAGNSVLLNANTGAGLTYQWKLNGNNISGATSSSYSANAAGNYSVVVTNTCGSSTSNVISVTINSAPSAAITASGSSSICAGNSVTLNANTGTGLTYQWKLNGNNISGATSSSYSATTAGNFSVVVSNSCGNSTSNVITVTILSAPSAAITASGSTSFCSGSFVTLTANTGTGLSYQWQLNGNNISGATNSNYDATTSGNYSVTVSNNCGNSISNFISVTSTSAPGSAGSISGPDTVCKHTTHTFSVNPVAGATNYVWSVPPQAQIISGAGTNSIAVNFKVKQGNVTIKAANQCGAGPLSVFPVTVVKCFNANNAVMRTISDSEISIYPNPSKNEFNCVLSGKEDQVFSLSVFDYAGRIIELHENIISNNNFPFGNDLSPGIYFVEINSTEEREVFKIVKIE